MLRSLATLSLLLASAACARDHSALAADDAGEGGRGGAGSSSSAFLASQGVGGGEGGAPATGVAGSGGAKEGGGGQGGERPDEPDGPPRLVVVHGVPDRERVAVCFGSLEGAGLDVAPFPTDGLAYATAAVAPPELLPEQGDVLVVLVASELDDLSDLRCDVLLDDPSESPEVDRFPVGAVPRSAIDAPRVLVLAMAGCLGGEGHEGEAAEAVCGVGYTPSSPTASLVVGTPSRLAVPGRVGLQAIGASLPTAPFDVLVGHAVCVRADNRPLFRARPTTSGSHLAVRIEGGHER